MRFAMFLVAAALAAAACSSGSDSTATPEPTPTGSATAAPTASGTTPPGGGGGLDPTGGDASFVAVIDLDSLQPTVRFNSGDTWNTWFEPSGDVVSALVIAEGVQPRAVRFAADGSVVTDTADELQHRENGDGSARAFGAQVDDTGFFRTYLEVNGELIDLDGEPTVLPIGFSPQGDQLLSYVGVAPDVPNEAAIAYTVHRLDGSVASRFVNRLSVTQPTSNQVTWSPSGRYVAADGILGLTAHDVEAGETIPLGPGGWTEWSPTEDALLVIGGPNELQIVRLPDLEIVSIAVGTSRVAASFDPTGEVVVVSDAGRRRTTVFDATSGEVVLEIGGLAEAPNIVGFDPVIMTPDGLAFVVEGSPGCDGILVVHPSLPARGQCLEGTNPRWAPDAGAVSYTRGPEVIVFDVETLEELTVASGVPEAGNGTLARWNGDGTQLLLEWPWGEPGWSDSLP